MALLDDDFAEKANLHFCYVQATRLINGQDSRGHFLKSISTLDFFIDSGPVTVASLIISIGFGMKQKIRLGLEYGITDRLMIGSWKSSMERRIMIF